MRRALVALVTTATLATGAVAVVAGLGLFSGPDDFVTDKPRPPQIVITR